MILEAFNLIKFFRSSDSNSTQPLKILKGVSLSVDKGEIVAIVGASGSGKTTLLNLLGLLDSPDDGDIFFLSKPIVRNGKHILTSKEMALFRNSEIGFVFQFHHLLEDFTAIENTAFPFFLKTGSLPIAKKSAKEILEKLGLGKRLHHLPSQLSGGEQQRVAIARAMINQPKLILADEPSGNLDSKASHLLYEIIESISKSEGTAFLIATHSESYAKRSSKTFEMKDGILLKFA